MKMINRTQRPPSVLLKALAPSQSVLGSFIRAFSYQRGEMGFEPGVSRGFAAMPRLVTFHFMRPAAAASGADDGIRTRDLTWQVDAPPAAHPFPWESQT